MLGHSRYLLIPVLVLASMSWNFHDALPQDKGKPVAIGQKVPDSGSLRDLRGNRRALSGFKGNRALVLVFLGAECPLSNLYLPGLIHMEKEFRSRGVQFLGIYPNEHEDLDQVAAHARDRDIPFPVLKDVHLRLADILGVKRVPTVAVVDGDFVLRYRGRVDDRYGIAFRRKKATREDLREAISALIAGKKVAIPETETDGCLLDRGGKAAHGPVTYSQVGKILHKHCQVCHRPGEAGPFSLLTYENAVRHGAMIKEVVTQRRMPPWHADQRFGKFSNNRSLGREEIEVLAAWVDQGMPRGKDKDGPAPAWAEGWQLGQPDLVVGMPKEFDVPADGVVPYQRFLIEKEFTEDHWVRMAEARPGNREVVHHFVAYVLPPGMSRPFAGEGMVILVGWAPGDLGLVCPPDTGLKIRKGSKLVLELHYTPNGKAVKDRSRIGITFAKKPPCFELQMNNFVNEAIVIPPHDPHYKAEATIRFRDDARILSAVPHMHWRGKDYLYEVIFPDGKRQTILSVPRYDFNWQSVYRFDPPIRVPKGARLHAVAHWDNSRNNPYNPDPAKEVRFGLQTWDEMMVGWVTYVWENPQRAEKLAHADPADALFDHLDRNGDDVITPDEIPSQMRIFLIGRNLPERMTREEFGKLYREMRELFKKKRGGEKKK